MADGISSYLVNKELPHSYQYVHYEVIFRAASLDRRTHMLRVDPVFLSPVEELNYCKPHSSFGAKCRRSPNDFQCAVILAPEIKAHFGAKCEPEPTRVCLQDCVHLGRPFQSHYVTHLPEAILQGSRQGFSDSRQATGSKREPAIWPKWFIATHVTIIHSRALPRNSTVCYSERYLQ